MQKNYRYFCRLALFLAIISLLASCGKEKTRPLIAVSIPPQATLLKEIVGDSIDVVTLLRADSNPETFEATVSDLKEISRADAYFRIGNLPFESQLTEKIGRNADLKFYDNSEGIALLYGTHSHGDCAHAYGEADPHTWSSVGNLKVIAQNMYDAVVEVDPANREYYTANYRRLDARLDSLNEAFTQRLAPLRGTAFLIWHPSLSYFAADYGLEQIAVGQENKEISVNRMADIINEAREENVTTMFVQRNFDASQSENVVRELNVVPVTINPLSADWQNELEIIVNALTE